MTAVSLIVSRGAWMKNSDFTVGATAPASGDIQFCWNQTDALGKNITRKDLKMALKAFMRAVQQGGATVDVTTGVIGPP